jgi:hypothetical protein
MSTRAKSARKSWPNPFQNPCEHVTDTDRAIEIFRSFVGLPKPPAMDTETEVVKGPDGKSLPPDPLQSRIAVMSMACRRDLSKGPEYDGAYVLFLRDMDKPKLTAALQELNLEFYGWNAGFDDPVVSCGLRQSWGEIGWKFWPITRWRDLMIGESIRRLGREGHTWHAGLAAAAKQFLDVDVEGKGTVQLSYKVNEPLDQEQIDCAASDALVTLWLSDIIGYPGAAGQPVWTPSCEQRGTTATRSSGQPLSHHRQAWTPLFTCSDDFTGPTGWWRRRPGGRGGVARSGFLCSPSWGCRRPGAG